jgi:hypothetical protein
MSGPTICARCGEEVRFGVRATGPLRWHDAKRWLHRDHDDHIAILGQPVDQEALVEAIARARGLVDEESEVEEIPPPEVWATPVEATDERVPQGARNKLKLATENGWTAWATYSRGARVHKSQGTLLGISDFVVVRFRLDGTPKVAVACWEDGKMQRCYTAIREDEKRRFIVAPTNDAGLKAWLKQEE